MRRRCTDKNSKDYKDYGARGITVCDRWQNSFTAFLSDMGERPFGKTLDRNDVFGNYEPANCTWASSKQQSENKRNSKRMKS
jgi:hypothetical protein